MMTFHSRAAQFAKWNAARAATGYRSQFEADVAASLAATGTETKYEPCRIPYVVNLTAIYKPDWTLPKQAIVLEAKGQFTKDDRDKMLRIKTQYPHLDIRIIFQNPKAKVAGKLTYRQWAEKHGFPFCKGPTVPSEWIQYKPSLRNRKAFDKVCEDASPPK